MSTFCPSKSASRRQRCRITAARYSHALTAGLKTIIGCSPGRTYSSFSLLKLRHIPEKLQDDGFRGDFADSVAFGSCGDLATPVFADHLQQQSREVDTLACTCPHENVLAAGAGVGSGSCGDLATPVFAGQQQQQSREVDISAGTCPHKNVLVPGDGDGSVSDEMILQDKVVQPTVIVLDELILHPHDQVDFAQPIVIALDELILHSGKNHQRQLCEPACKNVSVKNYQEASRLVGLMTNVRDSRRARTRWCTKIAGDMRTQNQPHPPRVLNLADLVVGCGHDVGDVSEQILGDVSAQNHQRQLRDPACKNVSVKNHQEASRHVSAKNQQQQLHEHGRGVDWAQTHQQQLHEHDVGDISGKNHQRQLCEPACKNVSVQNHPWQSYLIGVEDVSAQNQQQQQIVVDLAENLAEDGHGVEDVSAWAWRGKRLGVEVLKLLMSDVRSCRCALAHLLHARGARDMLAHNQSQPPLVFLTLQNLSLGVRMTLETSRRKMNSRGF